MADRNVWLEPLLLRRSGGRLALLIGLMCSVVGAQPAERTPERATAQSPKNPPQDPAQTSAHEDEPTVEKASIQREDSEADASRSSAPHPDQDEKAGQQDPGGAEVAPEDLERTIDGESSMAAEDQDSRPRGGSEVSGSQAPPRTEKGGAEPTTSPSPSDSGAPKTSSETARAKPKPTALVPFRDPVGFEIGAGLAVTWIDDSSFDLFSEGDAWPAVSVGVGQRIWGEGLLEFSATLNYQFAATGASVRGASTWLENHRAFGGVRMGLDALTWLKPYARIGLGVSHVGSQLAPDGPQAPRLSSTDFAGTLALGAQARLVRTRGVVTAVGLYAEAAALVTSEFALDYQLDDSAFPRAQPVTMGELFLAGPQAEAGLVVGF